jgi:hypothetical protein
MSLRALATLDACDEMTLENSDDTIGNERIVHTFLNLG